MTTSIISRCLAPHERECGPSGTAAKFPFDVYFPSSSSSDDDDDELGFRHPREREASTLLEAVMLARDHLRKVKRWTHGVLDFDSDDNVKECVGIIQRGRRALAKIRAQNNVPEAMCHIRHTEVSCFLPRLKNCEKCV
jgi:hypothetical protein